MPRADTTTLSGVLLDQLRNLEHELPIPTSAGGYSSVPRGQSATTPPRSMEPVRSNYGGDSPEGTWFMDSSTIYDAFRPIRYACEECKKERTGSSGTTHTGRVCATCLGEGAFSKCHSCAYWVKKSDLILKEINNGKKYFCEECVKRDFYDCVDCSCETHWQHDSQSYQVVLDEDGDTCNENRTGGGLKTYVYCTDCFNRRYFICAEHGDVEKINDAVTCSTCSRRFCFSCDDHTLDCNNDGTLTFYKGKREDARFLTVDRFIGVEIEAENGRVSKIDTLMPGVNAGRDGSLNETGIEVTTPPASLSAAEAIVEDTTKKMRDAGYRGTKAAGLHIHIDVRDIKNDPEKIGNLIKTIFATEDLLYSMLPPSRWNNHYCKPLNKEYLFKDFQRAAKLLAKDIPLDEIWYKSKDKNYLASSKRGRRHNTRYFGLNIHSIYYRGTIEFRYHSGTVSSEKILNWAEILLCIVDYAINRYNEDNIKALFDMETSADKFYIFRKEIGLPTPQVNYMNNRANFFNPGFAVQFNKGKSERESMNILLKEKEKLIKELTEKYIPKAKIRVRQDYGFIRDKVERERLRLNYAQNYALEALPNKYRNLVGETGFITTDELYKVLGLIATGANIRAERNGDNVDDES